MPLTAEQLSEIADWLKYSLDYQESEDDVCRAMELKNACTDEWHRLKQGPFTLAEAVASGRPFRRKDPNGDGQWMTAAYLDTYDYADTSGLDDYVASDYELQPEGGE